MIPRATKTISRFDRRVWLLLFAMLAFRFGHGLYFPFSSIYFHNALGIPLSLVARLPALIWTILLAAAAFAAAGLVALALLRRRSPVSGA